MRATEFIRQLLDIIDTVEQTDDTNVVDYEQETPSSETDIDTMYSNSPNTQVASMDNLLSVGNDINKPKHPADIRVSTVALYPDTAYKG